MILITGATQGIGYECARALLARTDSTVLITGRNAARLTTARARLPDGLRDRLLTRVCDQGRRRDVEQLGTYLGSDTADLEGAILNVGINPAFLEGPRRLHTVPATTIDDTVRTNCTHLLLLTTAVLDRLWARRAGSVVWIGSQAPSAGLPGAAVYCATKSFLSGLARAAHNEYAHRGIHVHLLHPALVRTPRTATTIDSFAATHGLAIHAADEVAATIVDHYLGVTNGAVEVAL
jgi:short-subunit dehydrogenase